MRKRVYGLENEYGMAVVKEGGSWTCEPMSLAPFLDRLHRDFLPNGARLYVDMQSHPEYCTAECVDLADLVAQDKAGEKILDSFISDSLKREHRVKRVLFFKNNVQYADTDYMGGFFEPNPITYGCHENFLMDSELRREDLACTLIPFLIARQIVAGSGWVANPVFQKAQLRYAISQRTRFITRLIGESTTSGWERAIFCTARWTEAHADESKYRRLHLIMGDSNMSELSTYLKMGAVGILLEMLEEGYPVAEFAAELMPSDPVKDMQAISFDLTCKKPVIFLPNGKKMSALNMFWEYVKMMSDYQEKQGLSPQLSDVLVRLIDILQRLEKRQIDSRTLLEIDSQGLDEELDWLIKKSILDHVLRACNCGWHDFYGKKIVSGNKEMGLFEKMRANDLRYHDISQSGLYNDYVAEPDWPISKFKKAGLRTPRVVDKEKVENMQNNAPQNSRAKLRSDFMHFLQTANIPREKFYITWNYISPHGLEGVRLLDPFATQSEALDMLQSRIYEYYQSQRQSASP